MACQTIADNMATILKAWPKAHMKPSDSTFSAQRESLLKCFHDIGKNAYLIPEEVAEKHREYVAWDMLRDFHPHRLKDCDFDLSFIQRILFCDEKSWATMLRYLSAMCGRHKSQHQLIYEAATYKCDTLFGDINSIINRARNLLIITISLILGYLTLVGSTNDEASFLVWVAFGIFLVPSALLARVALWPIGYTAKDLNSDDAETDNYYNGIIMDVQKAAIALREELAFELTKKSQKLARIYVWGQIIWLICLGSSILMLILEHTI